MSDMNDVTCTVAGTLMWVKNNVEDKEYPGTWGVDVCNLSAAAVARLKEIGLEGSLKHSEELGDFIKLKSNRPIPTEDADGKIIKSEVNEVGNGSKGTARVWAFTVTKKGKLFGKVSAKCLKLKVTELLEYTGSDDEEEAL
jgi:hypothetical protein